MKGAWYIGSVRGIPIQIHWSFSLLLLWSGYVGYGMGGWPYVGFSICLTMLLFACVVLHELGHALTAQFFGVGTRNITLFPIGGVASLNRIPEKPREEFLITLAGPMVNVVIVVVLYARLGWPGDGPRSGGLWSPTNIGFMLMYTNMVMVVFNMIPAFPMDGGRMLRALLAVWLPYPRATAVAAAVGRFLAVGMMIAGVFYNPILSLIGLMIYMGAKAENNWVAMKSRLDGYRVRDLMVPNPVCLDVEDSVARCSEIAVTTGQRDFIVTFENRIAGMLPQTRWMQCLRKEQGHMPAGRVMQSPTLVLDENMPASAALRVVTSSSRQTVFPVVSDGVPIGVITRQLLHDLAGLKESRSRRRRGAKKRSRGSFIDVG